MIYSHGDLSTMTRCQSYRSTSDGSTLLFHQVIVVIFFSLHPTLSKMQATRSNELCHLYSAERLQLKSPCRAWQVSPLRVTADLFFPPSDERKWQTLAGRPDPHALVIYSAWRAVLIFPCCQVAAFNSSRQAVVGREEGKRRWDSGEGGKTQDGTPVKQTQQRESRSAFTNTVQHCLQSVTSRCAAPDHLHRIAWGCFGAKSTSSSSNQPGDYWQGW